MTEVGLLVQRIINIVEFYKLDKGNIITKPRTITSFTIVTRLIDKINSLTNKNRLIHNSLMDMTSALSKTKKNEMKILV